MRRRFAGSSPARSIFFACISTVSVIFVIVSVIILINEVTSLWHDFRLVVGLPLALKAFAFRLAQSATNAINIFIRNQIPEANVTWTW